MTKIICDTVRNFKKDDVENLIIGSRADLYKEAWDKGYQAGVKSAQPKWISVEEKLPEECAFYLTYSRRCRIMVLIFYPQWKTWVNGETGKFEIKVTHWMPLPEPPKEEE